jgi:hypothetical protein
LKRRYTKSNTHEISSFGADVVAEWTDELTERLGRPKETLLGNGLRANDFSPDRSVEIRFADGSHAKFQSAFALISEKRGRVAVFTQQCGYLEFQLAPGMEVVQTLEEHYRHETIAF